METAAGKEVVTWPIAPLPPGPPATRERMFRTAPRFATRATALVLRLPAGNRVRRRGITEAVRIGFAMYERRDYEPMTALYSPEFVYDLHGMGDRRPPDMDVEYHGHAGLMEVLSALSDMTARFGPSEIADGGGSVFAARVDTRIHGEGLSAGLEVGLELGHVYLVRGGLCIRQHSYVDWEEALAALGDASAGRPPWGGDPARHTRG